MPTTKLRAPDNFGSLSIEGRAVEIGRDGSLHADHRDIATLRSHGFTDWHDHPGAGGDIETMTREQLIEAACARTREEASKLDTEKLRDHMRAAAEHEAPPPDPVEIMTEQRINAMSRDELFGYLKENNVGIGPATGDEKLRAAALDTFRKLKQPATA